MNYRKILRTEIPSMQRTSKGIILICKNTRRVLCVERGNTPEFLHFMRGFYRRDNIRRDIIPACDIKEHLLLKSICNDPERRGRREKIYRFLMERYHPDKVQKCIDIAASNFEEDLDEIKSCLDQIPPRDSGNWMFPKGGINKGETDIECALRELKEESSVEISRDLISGESLSIDATSFFGAIFKTQYFIAYTDIEIPLSDVYDKTEISNVAWISVDNLEKEIISGYQKLIPSIKGYFPQAAS